jgi:outer membrane protein TolC
MGYGRWILVFLPCAALGAQHFEPPAGALRLQDVRQAVLERDPVLAGAQTQAEMAESEALAAYAWDAPQFAVERMGMDASRPNLNDPASSKWSLTQNFPFPGRTLERGRAADHAAAAVRAETEGLELRELSRTREAYYSLFAADLWIRGLEIEGEAAAEMRGASRRRAESGALDRMGQFMDTMLEMEISRIESRKPGAGQQKAAAEAELNRLMGNDPFAPLGTPQVDIAEWLAEGLPTEAALLTAAENRNPGLKAAQERLESARALARDAFGGWLPDVSVEGYWTVDNAGQKESGAMLGLSLPGVWFWKQVGESRKAVAARESAQDDLEAVRLALRKGVRDAVGEANAARDALHTLWSQTCPQADRGLDLARAGFRTGALGPTEALMGLQNYEMAQQELAAGIARYGKAQAELETLAGGYSIGGAAQGAKP